MATAETIQTDLVTLEIDGREVRAPRGAMIIEAADNVGIDIPRFCYHRKLSIAANCRMCLVDVEKAPKPLPACATPVAEGMKVFTESKRAVDAQRGVMEFLLINHPLDCPICDQGGECELQDLAMGYGRSVSRFTERKRVVKDKNLGPLVATDMTRCIHCTRCVRFLQEIAGTAELGGVGRGEHLEISTFVERNIHSELSGNIIDLCPVGALTDKPFRFSARAWEMQARPAVAGHDCVGSNLFHHVRGRRVMRTVPRDNEAVNECWLADRDRYGHRGLYAQDRVLTPRVKVDGQWHDVDWDTALNAARNALAGVREAHGASQLGFLAGPRATTEEYFLLRQLARGLECENIDHRLRLADFSHADVGRAHMDLPSARWSAADAIFLVGSNIRQEQPILGHRIRTAWRRNQARVMDLNPVAFDFHFDRDQHLPGAPQNMVETLARVARAALDEAGLDPADDELGAFLGQRVPDEAARHVARQLKAAAQSVIVLGDMAVQHPQAGWLRSLAKVIADACESALCILPAGTNSEGAWLAGAVPGDKGLDAAAQLAAPRKGYLLWDVEPEFDFGTPVTAMQALRGADKVVAVAAFAGSDLLAAADVLLPLAPVPETAGSYINLDGLRQRFKAAVPPAGDAREGWKILRVLGDKLGLDGFDFVNAAEVDQRLADATPRRPTGDSARREAPRTGQPNDLYRIGDVPMYAGDALVRRSVPLQQTAHGDNAWVAMHPATAEKLGVSGRVRVSQGGEHVELPLRLDARVAPAAVWCRSATCSARVLDQAYGPIKVEPAS